VLTLYSRHIITLDIYQGLYYLCIQDHIEKVYIEKFTAKCYELIVEELEKKESEQLSHFFEELVGSHQ
jgi:hypothetical protein